MADFAPVAFVDLAEDLLRGFSGMATSSSDHDQAKVRASVGRAYYGAFLVARETLRSLGKVALTGKPADHGRVIDALKLESGDLGDKLEGLRKKRNRADYNLTPKGFTLSSGQHWANIARELLRGISGLR